MSVQHRHAEHEHYTIAYPCGCVSVSCADCNLTDGWISTNCPVLVPGKSLGYVHPALVAPRAI